MATYPAVYRAKSVKYEAPVLTAYVPQVFGDVPIEITDVIGSTTQGMGWVFFQGGDPDFPVWNGGGGGSVSDVVWTGPDAPTDRSIELWWDTDEPPQGGGTEEVYIGAEPPGAGYELWYDTDADAPLTIDQRWNTAWGTVAYAQVTSAQGSITTVTDLVGLSVTVTAVAGRRYRVTGKTHYTSSVANDHADLIIATGANTSLNQGRAFLPNPSIGVDTFAFWVSTGADSGSTTWKLRALRQGTGTVTSHSFPGFPAFIEVEDLGPMTLVPAPPPPDWSMYDARYVNEGVVTAWNPAITGLTIGSGTQEAWYLKEGQRCHLTYWLKFAANTTIGSSFLVTLPFTALGWGASGAGYVFDANVPSSRPVVVTLNIKTQALVTLLGYEANESSYRNLAGAPTNVPWLWQVNDEIAFEMTYLTVT